MNSDENESKQINTASNEKESDLREADEKCEKADEKCEKADDKRDQSSSPSDEEDEGCDVQDEKSTKNEEISASNVNCDKSKCDTVSEMKKQDEKGDKKTDDSEDDASDEQQSEQEEDEDTGKEKLLMSTENSEHKFKLIHLTADRVKGPPKRRLPSKNKVQNEIANESLSDTKATTAVSISTDTVATVTAASSATSESKKKLCSPFVLELESKLKSIPKSPKLSANFDFKHNQTSLNAVNAKLNSSKEVTVNRASSFNTGRLKSTLNVSPPETLKLNSISKSSTVSAMHSQNSLPNASTPIMPGNNLFKLKQLETKCEEQEERIKSLEKELSTFKQSTIPRKEFDDLFEKVKKMEVILNSTGKNSD